LPEIIPKGPQESLKKSQPPVGQKTFIGLFGRIFGKNEESKVLLKATWALAWPVVLEQALSMVSQVVDMAMVGRLGADAVAAIGLRMQPFFLINALFMGLSVGTTALCARAIGAQDREGAGKVTGQSVIVAFVFGSFVSYLGFIKSEWIITFMKAEAPVRALGATYVRAMMPGMLLFVFTISTGALRGAGDTRTPMLINLGLNVVHVFTNYLLIFGNWGFPRLGLTYLFMNVFKMGLTAAWLAMFSDWVVRASLYWLRLKGGRWKTLKV